jgi:hypothetical protein
MHTFIAEAIQAECEVTYETFLPIDAEVFDNTGIFCLHFTNESDDAELAEKVFTSVQRATDYINAEHEVFNSYDNVTVVQMEVI